MEPPGLNEVSYFKIKPRVTLSELEAKLAEINLSSEPEVRNAINILQRYQSYQKRASEVYVLEEHIYPVAMLSIEHELRQCSGVRIPKEFVAAALLHDTLEDTPISLAEFSELFSASVSEIVLLLTDSIYSRNLNYEVKTRIKFGNLKDKRQAGVIALADKINNLLCMYTVPFIQEDGRPTPKFIDTVTIAENIVKPFAELTSKNFFDIMLTEIINYYKSKYPYSFAHYKR